MTALALSVLVLIGAATVLTTLLALLGAGVRLAYRRVVRPGLRRRHQGFCTAHNRLWAARVIRHAPSGRVGFCLSVCTRGHGLRDLLRPRWEAEVTFHPGFAGQLTAARSTATALGVVVMLGRSLTEPLPLAEMTLAPGPEAGAFRAAMEEAR